MKFLHKLLEHIAGVSHQFLSFLLGDNLTQEDIRCLKVRKEQDEHLQLVTRYLD